MKFRNGRFATDDKVLANAIREASDPRIVECAEVVKPEVTKPEVIKREALIKKEPPVKDEESTDDDEENGAEDVQSLSRQELMKLCAERGIAFGMTATAQDLKLLLSKREEE